jgi:hypothetical protein
VNPHPATEALAEFWTRYEAREALQRPTAADPAVELARPLDALVDLVENELIRAGLKGCDIRRNEAIVVSGSYTPSPKQWDLVVIDEEVPVAAVNFTWCGGHSVGRNFRNLVQEVIGDAVDLGRPYEPVAVSAFKPCLALFFVIEDNDATNQPRKTRSSGAATEPDYPEGSSYKDRYADVFERLVSDGRYDAICYLATSAPNGVPVSEPRATQGFAAVAQSIVDRVTEIRKLRTQNPLDPVEIGRMLAQRDDLGKVVLGIASTPKGLSAAEAAVIEHRRLVAQLRELAVADEANETKMHRALGTNYWIFGGQYVGVAKRSLMQLDQHDIPLVCADRSLHIVELKGPGSKIVRQYRSHLIVADEVHEAVSQCMNYLRSFDDMGRLCRRFTRTSWVLIMTTVESGARS